MAKSAFEKQIEKQMKQEKRLAQERARRERAASIVNGQPLVAGMRVMDGTAEEVLECLLTGERGEGNQVNIERERFPEYVRESLLLELEKLTQYGMISNVRMWISGGTLSLLPSALTYFKDKENAMERQQCISDKPIIGSITNYGNLVFGDVIGSELSVENSVHAIEEMIDERGGDEKEELYDLLQEVKELLENMEHSRSIPKQQRLLQRIADHAAKHGWLYGAIIQLLGTEAIKLLGS